jgi:hypothetical protein
MGTKLDDGRRTTTLTEDLIMKFHVLTMLALGPSALIACASTPGAQPSDMSAVQHEQAAAAHEGESAPHSAQYDPNAQTTTSRCDGKHPCWTSTSNPTEQHRSDAKKHHKMAEDHRAAAQTLRTAEAQACAGISDDDRDMSPFNHREDITGVQPAYAPSPRGKGDPGHLTGAVITFRAVPMLTAEWLQRIVDCHVARNNALGNDMPEMAYCPLVPKGVMAKVSSTGDGFAVTIESQDPNTSKEVLRRAQALKNPG